MMMLVAAVIGAFGLGCILSRRTLVGVLIGVQLLIMGGTMMFVISGIVGGVRPDGQLFGLFITLGGIGQLAAGYALAIRQFYLKGNVKTDELRSLKQ